VKIGSGGNDWRPFFSRTDEVLQSNGYTAFKYAVARETIPSITCLKSAPAGQIISGLFAPLSCIFNALWATVSPSYCSPHRILAEFASTFQSRSPIPLLQ
jgi:hypothetical protein